MPLDMVRDGHLGGYVRGGDPATWCPALWSWIVREHGIGSVLDVGCGEGHSTRYFHELGCEAVGVDGCEQAIRETAAPGLVVQHDFCQGPFPWGREFDMVWSCEFLEHVQRRYVPHLLGTFAAAKKLVLVTHAFPGQDEGHHHVNCQPSRYWIRQIESLGFECRLDLSLEARQRSLADYRGINHFARSGLVFVRRQAVAGSGGSTGWYEAWWKGAWLGWQTAYGRPFREQRRRRRAEKRRAA